MNIDVQKIKKIHFVGIKGVAMTALAVYAKEKGIAVTGSDLKEQFPTDEVLEKFQIVPMIGFSVDHVSGDVDIVIYTGAHGGRQNIEVQEAIKKHIPVVAHGQALGMFMEGKRQISVAGSHGKTTTSAMIATILVGAGRDPSYAVGCGDIHGLGSSGHFGKGDLFIAEADEYVTDPGFDKTPRFFWQHPDVFVVTNIDYDHPDVYSSLGAVKNAFITMQTKVVPGGVTIVNYDDRNSQDLLKDSKTLTYGISQKADVTIANIQFTPGTTTFELGNKTESFGHFSIHVAGLHNVINAAAAAIACHEVGVDWIQIKKGIAKFGGAARRFEKIEENQGIVFYDDYAHHPKEIEATLAGARLWYPNRRIIAVFQPHTYSRTKALLGTFATSWKDADSVLVSDIYASARESDTMGVTSQLLVDEINKRKKTAVYTKDAAAVTSYLKQFARSGDIVVFMGAGDIYTWEKEVINQLTK